MPLPLRTAIALALTAAALAAAPASAPAAPGMEVALQDDAVLTYRYYFDRERALQHARSLQVTQIRTNVLWSVAAGRRANSRRVPRRLSYDFSYWDALIAHAAAHGIGVQVALTGPAPRFASGNRRIGPNKPNVRLFRQFVRAAALHFRGRVSRYSIWNEPNHVGWLSPLRRSGAIYRRLYTAGYRAIKGVDPGAQVLIAETAPQGHRGRSLAPLRFLRQATCARRNYRRARRCATLRADGFAHHAYDFRRPPTAPYPGRDNVTIGSLGRLTRALDRLARSRLLATPGGAPLDIYITEYGYLQAGRFRISQSRRARYLVKAFQVAQRNPRVRQLLQYLLVRPARIYAFFDTAILTGRDQPQAPYHALAGWAQNAAAQGLISAPFTPPPPGDGGGGGGGGGEPPPGGGPAPPPAPGDPPPPPPSEPPPPPPPPETSPCPPIPPGLPCPPGF